MDRVAAFARKHSVIFLQEVHGCEGDISELQRLIPRHFIAGSFCENRCAGGVLIIVSRDLVERYTCVEHSCIVRGRALVVRLSGGGLDPLALCCVHLVPEWGVLMRTQFLDKVRANAPLECGLVLGGDLNFCAAGEGRLELSSGRVTISDDHVASHFDEIFWQLTEVASCKPTRRGTVNGNVSVVSRCCIARNCCIATSSRRTFCSSRTGR